MKWRKYPAEKPAKEFDDDPVWVFCCDDSREDDPEFIGQLLYKPAYEMFFRVEVRTHYGEVSMVEKQVEYVTHFAFEKDIIWPENDK